jgi:hypothetical protein
MRCQYCDKRLGIIQRLKGESFCSPEHAELHSGLYLKRLRDSITESTPDKPEHEDPEEPGAKREPPKAGASGRTFAHAPNR